MKLRSRTSIAVFALALVLGTAFPAAGKAAFPGSPGLIALQRSADPDESSIWVLNWQTGDARQLTQEAYDADPAFSPTGRWIAFRSDDSWHAYLNIWAIRPDGSGLHRLTKGKTELEADEPAFSPNGRWVAFQAAGRKRRVIERVPLFGGHQQLLVSGRGMASAFSPAYSPDGRHLAWVEWLETEKAVPHIYIGMPDGRRRRRLVAGGEPDFSPDGRSIVFLREGRCPNGEFGSAIYTLVLATGQLHAIASACGDELSSPAFSPDGGWIVYTRYSGLRSELAFTPVVRAPSQIAPLAGLGTDFPVDTTPSWQPIP